jgi:hypothetical protein
MTSVETGRGLHGTTKSEMMGKEKKVESDWFWA